MEKKTVGIIATIATALVCGCLGLIGLCLGGVSTLASVIPGADIDVFGSQDPKSALTMGLLSLCGGLVLIAIPIVVGFMTLRKKPTPATPPEPAEPLPPPS